MTVGTAVYLLGMHNPVEAAELTANLDIITGGKFVFGVGQGYRDVEFASFGVPKASRGRRMEEAVEVIRRLWAEDNVTREGEFFPMKGGHHQPQAGAAARTAHMGGWGHL